MKLSDYKGEAALDLLADLMEPVVEIIGDDKFKDMVRGGEDKLKIAKHLLKGHKRSILTVMALVDGQDPNTYEPNVLSIPLKLMELINDPDIVELFTMQGQKMD